MIHWQIRDGFVVKVDKEIFELVRKYKWYETKNDHTSYATTSINGKMISMHRFIMRAQKGFMIDHIDGDGLNNTFSNLRFCTHSQNMRNKRPKKGSSSKYLGVSFDKAKRRWLASITVYKKSIKLGLFKNEEDAAVRYNMAAKVYHGEFANLNNI